MITIDWKERLDKDTLDYLENKLPNKDYDFDIIFNAYPERVNGKIPSEVITYVSRTLVSKMGKTHVKYLPFYRHLWFKKGEVGRNGFITMMSRLLPKKPELYMPLFEEAMESGTPSDLSPLLERVFLPLLRKKPNEYLPVVYKWDANPNPEIPKATVNLLIKLMRREADSIDGIVAHYVNQWLKPLEESQINHITLMRALYKIDLDKYMQVWKEHGHLRDPETVEILCASVIDWDPQIEEFVQTWTLSGNARVKKAAMTAQRTLQKRKKKVKS
ncbi:MAG: hypothetical protein LHW44_02380 [Candidatus Cloacimonetes bacterium]|nr:hypothetical protein [Candidatus Cloacimonadota bacterium]